MKQYSALFKLTLQNRLMLSDERYMMSY